MEDRLLRKLQKANEDALSGNIKPVEFPNSPESIVALRKELKLNQKQFAERIHVSVHTVKSWESGRRSPGKQSRLIAGLMTN